MEQVGFKSGLKKWGSDRQTCIKYWTSKYQYQ